MNTGIFIARRLVSRSRGKFSFTFVVIAITSIALSVAIMFVAVAILTGFKKEIREKVAGFSGHIQVQRFSDANSFEPGPVSGDQPFLNKIKANPGITHVQAVATKAGIIKTRDHIQGVVFKGVGPDYDWSFFTNRMTEGKPFPVSGAGGCDSVIISKRLSEMLGLKLNDDLRVYFLSGTNTLGRKFRISGIYNTGLEEFDKLYIIGDIHHIRRINNWEPGEAGTFEIFIRDFDDLDRMAVFVYQQSGFDLDTSTIRMQYQQIFDWLDLQDINVLIILILVLLVSSTTIVSTLLIIILERTGMIGILKAMGMSNGGIRKVFLLQGMVITMLGLLAGNTIALVLCLLQKEYGIVKLSEESYYMSVIPVNLDIVNILLINAGTLLVCYLIFLLPSLIIARISPIRAIRFS